ncbi:hypothetical protein HJ131_20125 [Vibrio parahaemolyticus]|nr:hypothetical protein [Vibrio parahaemolyticus]
MMKSIINQLNNYTSNLTIEDICLLSNYDYEAFMQQYKKLVYITGMRQYWLITAKQQRNNSATTATSNSLRLITKHSSTSIDS